jgi:hypothetical protein
MQVVAGHGRATPTRTPTLCVTAPILGGHRKAKAAAGRSLLPLFSPPDPTALRHLAVPPSRRVAVDPITGKVTSLDASLDELRARFISKRICDVRVAVPVREPQPPALLCV